jgi:cell division protein FtsB
MTQRGDPPTYPGSGRSIYERLGLTPIPDKPSPKPIALPSRPAGKRWLMRGLLLLLLGIALLGTAGLLDVGIGRRNISLAGTSGDEQQRLFQSEQIAQLELRVEVLEEKVRTLQQANMLATDAKNVQQPNGRVPPEAHRHAAH